MEKLTLNLTDSGEAITAPFSLYHLEKRNEYFMVLGFDLSAFRDRVKLNQHSPHLECNQLGKLSELGFINRERIMHTLYADGWDWMAFPDPEIILVKDNSVKEKIILS